MLECVCENEGLRILVKWVYEQNQVIIIQEFVNLNISREVCDRPWILQIIIEKCLLRCVSRVNKILPYSAILVITVLSNSFIKNKSS